MKILLILGSIIGPLVMILGQKFWPDIRRYYHVAALLSALVFGNISSLSIYEIIKDKTVFMTNIHGIFLNPLFLITGAYLGVYMIYLLVLRTIEKKD